MDEEVPVTTPQTAVAPDLAARLAGEPDVIVAYLFGSQARGTARPGSDVDVAVLLAERADGHQRQLELMAALGGRADVVVLNDAPVALAHRVLRDGVVLVCRDDRVRVSHWARTVDRYLDTAPLRRMVDAGLRHRLREGRFGRS
ncbi:MAG: type VII toxin-antitoxin system MntA family adenylyltransferase antitoxin [Egibacteraceae bacterium]